MSRLRESLGGSSVSVSSSKSIGLVGKEDGESVVADVSRPVAASLAGNLVGTGVGSNFMAGVVVGKTGFGVPEVRKGRGTPVGASKEVAPGLKAPSDVP